MNYSQQDYLIKLLLLQRGTLFSTLLSAAANPNSRSEVDSFKEEIKLIDDILDSLYANKSKYFEIARPELKETPNE